MRFGVSVGVIIGVEDGIGYRISAPLGSVWVWASFEAGTSIWGAGDGIGVGVGGWG